MFSVYWMLNFMVPWISNIFTARLQFGSLAEELFDQSHIQGLQFDDPS
jgi:hypothetical protein